MIANAALTLSALVVIAQTSLPFSVQFAAGVIAVIYALWQLRSLTRQHGLLLWQEGWQWVELNSQSRTLELQRAVIWPGLIVLHFCDLTSNCISKPRHRNLLFRYLPNRNLTLTLCRDSLSTDDARRLRAYLRHWPVLAE